MSDTTITAPATSTGGGFGNVIEGIERFPEHVKEWLVAQETAHPSIKAAITFLQNSISTIATEIDTKGLPVVKAAAISLSTEIAGALVGTTTKAAAGSAAIATVKAAGETVADDTLHILATDLLTDVAAAVA